MQGSQGHHRHTQPTWNILAPGVTGKLGAKANFLFTTLLTSNVWDFFSQ